MVWKLLNLHTLFDRLLADLFDDGWMSPLSLADADCTTRATSHRPWLAARRAWYNPAPFLLSSEVVREIQDVR